MPLNPRNTPIINLADELTDEESFQLAIQTERLEPHLYEELDDEALARVFEDPQYLIVH